MVLIVGWLFCALVGLLIGQKKKRPTAGFLWGLILGPIGWLIVAVGPNMGPKCPECKGDIVAGARKCKNCGADLIRGQAAAAP